MSAVSRLWDAGSELQRPDSPYGGAQAWINRSCAAGQGDTVEAERLEHTRHRVEHRHVGVGDETLGDRGICAARQIQHQAPLVAVPRQVAGLVAAAFASRRVDLDHLGAEIAQMHGCHRRGAVV